MSSDSVIQFTKTTALRIIFNIFKNRFIFSFKGENFFPYLYKLNRFTVNFFFQWDVVNAVIFIGVFMLLLD